MADAENLYFVQRFINAIEDQIRIARDRQDPDIRIVGSSRRVWLMGDPLDAFHDLGDDPTGRVRVPDGEIGLDLLKLDLRLGGKAYPHRPCRRNIASTSASLAYSPRRISSMACSRSALSSSVS